MLRENRLHVKSPKNNNFFDAGLFVSQKFPSRQPPFMAIKVEVNNLKYHFFFMINEPLFPQFHMLLLVKEVVKVSDSHQCLVSAML
jgi:hypothetical protein